MTTRLLAATALTLLAMQSARGAQAPTPDVVTYSKDIAPIVFSKCASCHHPDGGAPFSLLSYADTRARARLIADVTRQRQMPPWQAEPGPDGLGGPDQFVGQHPLNNEEIATIGRWVQGGTPEGDRRDLPRLPLWTAGWQLGTPDLVITLKEPYQLQADGTDVSRVFVIPIPTDRLRFVKGIEFRPGNSRVVHHANIRLDRTRASRQLDDEDPAPGYDGVIWRTAVYPDGYFLGWTPGQVAPLLPKGLGWRLEAASDLVVQVHMVPSGKPEAVQPSIAFYFTDSPPERTPVMIRLARQNIDIPAGVGDYTITDSFVLPADAEVQAVQPHAHYLAHEVRGTATLPDGTTRSLIAINNWDFRWQHVYRYVTPFVLPRGTTVSMRYTYDNTIDNPRNPAHPPTRVVWGQRTRDEMGDLWIQVLARSDRDRQAIEAASTAKERAEDIVGYENMVIQYPSRAGLHDDVAVLYLEQGRLNDAARHLAASVVLKPDSASAHFNYGTVLTQLGRLTNAIDQYGRALEIRPDYALAHNNLATTLLRIGRADEALAHFREAVRLDPANAEAHGNLGGLLRARGDAAGAIGELRRAVELNPDSITAVAGLASLLATTADATLRRPAEAVAMADRAAGLTGRRDAGVLDVLAAAYAAAGRFAEAMATAETALTFNPTEPLASSLRQRLDLYRQGQAFISSR